MSDAIAAVRGFNRFFTQHVGALAPGFLGTELSLAEARLLFEIAQVEQTVAADLQAALDMDGGFVSRILRRFEARGWITRGRAEGDGRRRPIALTAAGTAAFEALDRLQLDRVQTMLSRLGGSRQTDLAAALSSARLLIGDGSLPRFTLRIFRAGDMGMIAARQSMLYRDVYGWGTGIEINVCEVTAAFLRNFKPGREQCWVADIGGAMAGSIFLTDEGGGLARLRLLYVEPTARGLGIGDALVSTCLGFARQAGFHSVTLWTHTILETARRLYAAHGFQVIDVHVHDQFGTPIQSETWELSLAAAKDAA